QTTLRHEHCSPTLRSYTRRLVNALSWTRPHSDKSMEGLNEISAPSISDDGSECFGSTAWRAHSNCSVVPQPACAICRALSARWRGRPDRTRSRKPVDRTVGTAGGYRE